MGTPRQNQSDAVKRQGTPGATRSWKKGGFTPRAFGGHTGLQTPGVQLSDLQRYEMIKFSCSQPSLQSGVLAAPGDGTRDLWHWEAGHCPSRPHRC